MCQGYSACPDKEDRDACDQTLRCVGGFGDGFSSYAPTNTSVLTSELAPGHRYCDYAALREDGVYDTIGRTGERRLGAGGGAGGRGGGADWGLVGSCTTAAGSPGLSCGEDCVENYLWCMSWAPWFSCAIADTHFLSNDMNLCANHTFWKEKTCEKISNSKIVSYGKRCTGAWQQCIRPWYLSTNEDYEVLFIICWCVLCNCILLLAIYKHLLTIDN